MEESEQINFAIDNYDDIFSDFDNRDYNKRSLSDDFLSECRRASNDKKNQRIELLIVVPKDERNPETEETIKKRLNGHFVKHYNLLLADKKKAIKKSLAMIFVGAVLSTINTLIHYYYDSYKFLLLSIMLVIFEPAAWFFIWEGFSRSVFYPLYSKNELEFYRKMSKVSIYFVDYKSN